MGEGGVADLGVLESVLGELSGVLARSCVLVTKSAVPVGTSHRAAELLGRADVRVVSNPEFLGEGHAVRDVLHPDRIVIGSADSEAADHVSELYRATGAPVLRTEAAPRWRSTASNAFFALMVSYVNVLAELCERMGADITEVSRTMGLDGRIGHAFLSPGPGWGGSCLPKDTNGLLRAAEAVGVDFAMLRDAVKANARQHALVVRKVRQAVTGSPAGSLTGIRLGLLGLTFEAGTGDLRHSPALAIAGELTRAGPLLTAYDPCVPLGARLLDGLRVVDDPYVVAKDVAAIVVLTEWPQFRDLDWSQLAAIAEHAVVVDSRSLLDREGLAGTGFTHTGIGASLTLEGFPRRVPR
jgi:UDPglucose 6-dehydrogenase